nr:LysR family transcriptional regulator [Marinicella sp. W31]MDC2875638.1 LysR family transcriptional regulator [Marinicella sp. W31]
MKTTLRQLEYVVAASQARSIARAAEKMRISTSSILAAIDSFEQEFGTQVFVRQRSKGLITTAAGERVIARTIRLLDETRSFSEDLMGRPRQLTGELRVGAFTSVSPNIAPLVIRDLAAEHPELIVHLLEGDIISIQQHLRDGEVDILLTYDAGLHPDFESEVLTSAPPHVVLPQNDPLATHEAVTLTDLAGRALLLLNLPHSSRYVSLLFEREGVTPGPIQKFEIL